MSPVRAFMLLGAVATVVPLTILATRPEAAPTTAPAETRSPDFSLTDEEAIAEFERLNESLMAAYRERNIALAESIFTSDSPMLPRVRKEINTLIESDVRSLTRFEVVSTTVVHNSASRLALERLEILRPRFETEAGRDVTGSRAPERERTQWELRVEEGTWLLHDAVVTDRKMLRSRGES